MPEVTEKRGKKNTKVPEQTGPSPWYSRRSMGLLLFRFLVFFLFLAGLLFIPAGRLDWVEAWLFIGTFIVFLLFYTLWGLQNDPGQIAERSKASPNVKDWDKVIMTIYTILLLVMMVVASLDAGRFRWSSVPLAVQVLAWIGMALAGGLIRWVASVNTFLSSMVRIQEERGHQVIKTGPYRWVRHPMYVGLIIFMMCVPLALGSDWGLIPSGMIGILFILRTALEDRMLMNELPGYREYADHVHYRLLPGIW
jgi:protein-S-isoprenylcysteine O-methyltransferase Ste14